MTYLVVGGSSGLGRALAERFARAGHPLVLVSSDLRDTRALAADLKLRHQIPVIPVVLDLKTPLLGFADIDSALAALPPLAGLLLPAGMSRPDDHPGQSPDAFDALTNANYTALGRLIGHFLPRLRLAPSALIIGFGSVAATRGRTRNAAYSAAKRALQSYFESLRHALTDSNVRVQFYVLGYLDTNLSFGQRTPLPVAGPDQLADVVYRRRLLDFGAAYYPRFWYAVCAVLRALPWAVFRRLSF
jgi:NAD(P)-dependent dehydrogenase (short-subunit alcohol dehydrogenase family)